MELGQLGYHHGHERHKVDGEIGKVVVGVMRAQQKQHDRYCQEKLLRGGILVTIVDLLPHVEVVVCSGVELEGYTTHPMKHKV